MSCYADGSCASARISTLDLVSVTQWRMLLLLRSGSECHTWAQAASTLVRLMAPLLGIEAPIVLSSGTDLRLPAFMAVPLPVCLS